MVDDALSRDLLRMAGRPELAAAVRANLEHLRTGTAGRELAEMAEDLLAGRITLRQVAHSTVYAEHILSALDDYRHWRHSLDSAAFAAVVRQLSQDEGTHPGPDDPAL